MTGNHSTTKNTDNYTDAALLRFSTANRAFMQTFVQLRRNEGLRAKSVYAYVQATQHLDRHLDGKPFADATAAELRDFVTSQRQAMAASTVFANVFKVRRVLRDAHGLDKLPKAIQAALTVKAPKEQFVGRIVTDDEFGRLLVAGQERGQRAGTLPTAELSQAILWTLRDSGFRAQELLSLNVGDVSFDGARGAKLALRPEAPGLKTGARTIYVCRCVGALRTWLELHPRGTDPKAPLFTGFYDRTGTKRLQYQRLLEHLYGLGDRSGVNAGSSRIKKVSPHDFRHTAATEKAKAGWVEEEMRLFFGWAPGSIMPSLYIHLSLGDMRERVRRDAGVDNLGFFQAVPTMDPAQALATLIQQLARQPPTLARPEPAATA